MKEKKGEVEQVKEEAGDKNLPSLNSFTTSGTEQSLVPTVAGNCSTSTNTPVAAIFGGEIISFLQVSFMDNPKSPEDNELQLVDKEEHVHQVTKHIFFVP